MDTYLERITPQHKVQPKFMAGVAAKLEALGGVMELALELPRACCLDEAEGAQLDTLGRWIGVGRTLPYNPSDGSSPVMDDSAYRAMLRARVAQNNWDGTIAALPGIWANVYPGGGLAVRDNQDMTMTVVLTGAVEGLSKLPAIAAGYVVPKPAGVRFDIMILEEASTRCKIYHATGTAALVSIVADCV